MTVIQMVYAQISDFEGNTKLDDQIRQPSLRKGNAPGIRQLPGTKPISG